MQMPFDNWPFHFQCLTRYWIRIIWAHNFYWLPFLSDPSLIIGNPCQWLTHLPTHCLVDLIDVTLAFEYANSKLVEVVTVANVDDEDHVGKSLL